MNKFRSVRFLSLGVIGFSTVLFTSSGLQALDLQTYLEEVELRSLEFLQADEAGKAAKLREDEGRLFFMPYFASQTQVSHEKDTGVAGFPPAGTVTRQFQQNFSLQKNWATGTLSRLTHALVRNDRDGITGVPNPAWLNLMEVRVEQSLWSNFFGKRDRAQRDVQVLAQQAESFRQEFQKDLVLLQAESAYWNLALSIEVVRKLEEALGRTKAS
jgi:hypothetical protein